MPEQTAEGSWMERMDQAFAAPPTAAPDPAPEPSPDAPPVIDAAPTEPSAPAPASDAASDVPASPEAPAPTDPPAAVPPAAPTPFTFRVDGRDVSPKGAVVQPDGTIAFTKDGFRAFQQQYVADRSVWRQREAQYQQQIQQAQQSQSAEQARAAAVLDRITAAIRSENPSQAIYDMAIGFAAEFPKLTAEAEAAYWRKQAEAREQQVLPQQAQQQWESWKADREDALDQVIDWAAQQEEWKALEGQTGPVRAKLSELSESGRLWQQGEDGQWRIDATTFKWFMGLHVEAAKARQEAAQAKAAAQLTQRNQATLTPRVPVPPTPSPSVPAPVAGTGTAGVTAKQRWQAFKEAETL